MVTKNTYESLTESFLRLNRLDHAITVLSWDQMVMMPAKGIHARSETLADLSVMRHELLSSDALGDELRPCQDDAESLTQPQQRSLAAMAEAHQNASCLPADLVKAQVLAGSRCEYGWRSQRGANDWTGFLKNFTEVVSLSREEATIRQSSIGSASPYDALLDLHCRGDSSELIDGVFSDLKARSKRQVIRQLQPITQ